MLPVLRDYNHTSRCAKDARYRAARSLPRIRDGKKWLKQPWRATYPVSAFREES